MKCKKMLLGACLWISMFGMIVAVIGGGIAGVAAAIQAARSGKKTILIEKTILLGGLATGTGLYLSAAL